MKPQDFERIVQAKANQIKTYAETRFATTAGNITLRFINDNFRKGGFQGSVLKKWKPSKGTVLVKSGALRAANYYTTQPGQATIKNDMPYARVHNEGFKGTVQVKAHTRNTYGKVKTETGGLRKNGKTRTKTLTTKIGETKVKAHSRKMNIPQRQFMPINADDSPILNKAIVKEVTQELEKITNT